MIVKIEKKRSRKIKLADGEQFFSVLNTEEFEIDETLSKERIRQIKLDASRELDSLNEQMLNEQIMEFIKETKKQKEKK